MKSTLKIALDTQGNLNKPVIKVVQPIEVINPTEFDAYIGNDDDRDNMIKNLLQSPMNPWLNDWFEVHTRFPIPLNDELPTTHYITTIAAVDEDKLFSRFENSILNRMISYAHHVRINRLNQSEIPEPKIDKPEFPGDTFWHSCEIHTKITEFFKWLSDTGKVSWTEQQPDGSQLK